ncbi:RPII140-upstream gene protein [Oratosquilla oratoria]|uniref:RPII140-upstream gene protein n=1 Tax=Oratosquilla oratoria TaxID=337810 RepID=UPI003F760803
MAGMYGKMYSTFVRRKEKILCKTIGGQSLLGLTITQLVDNPDIPDKSIPTVQSSQKHAENVTKHETGWDRVCQMFTRNEYGELSPELSMVAEGTFMGLLTGTVIGGTIHSKQSYISFMERNQATAFQNHFEAKKMLQDKVTLGFARGAWIWGWRLSLFTGCFFLVTTTTSVYRGKSSIFEYMLGGGTAGALYKFKSGPRATLVGGIVGVILGTVAGSASLAVMYLTGTTMEDLRYWQYDWKKQHKEEEVQALRKLREQEADTLVKHHHDLLISKGEAVHPVEDCLKSVPDK